MQRKALALDEFPSLPPDNELKRPIKLTTPQCNGFITHLPTGK